jgi:polyhydroxybutyrate depolymerase
MPLHRTFLAALGLFTVAACSATDPIESSGSGGGGGSGASAVAGSGGSLGGSGAAPAAGSGVGAASGSAGISGSGGASGGAAGSTSGGSATGGTTNGGAAGAAVGGSASGAGGQGGSSGFGGGGTEASKPSAGCGKSGRPANGKVAVSGEKIIDFPTTYDGTKPFPLLIALHACGNQNTQWENLTKGSAFETDYVRLMPNTTDSGQCWNNYGNNIARVLQQYDEVRANYCVDENQVFAVGHSSGAQMLVNILSHKDDATRLGLKGVAPVAADPYNVALPIPVLYIAGKADSQRGAMSAPNTMQRFRAANMCADTSKPYTAITGCNSNDGPAVDPGCIVYDQCSVPTIWCSHNDPSYSGTNHGVPCFAIRSMLDFFKSL